MVFPPFIPLILGSKIACLCEANMKEFRGCCGINPQENGGCEKHVKELWENKEESGTI
jgi:hypothetical protein